MVADDELIPDDGLRDTMLDDESDGSADDTGRREVRRRSLLVWLLLLLLLLVCCLLMWRYSGIGKAPDQADVSERPAIKTAAIPDVTGMSKEDAIRVLEEAGFQVETDVSFDEVADPDTVVGQDPPGGSVATIGSTVFITVTEELSPGEAAAAQREGQQLEEVPDVVGWPRGSATDELRAAGFAVKVTGVYSDSVPAGVVISQTPGGGASAPGNSTVSLLVSLGSAPDRTVSVPSLVGLSQAAASSAVRSAGLEPRLLYQPNTASVGRVYNQSPAPGTEVPEDRLIFMLIGVDPN